MKLQDEYPDLMFNICIEFDNIYGTKSFMNRKYE